MAAENLSQDELQRLNDWKASSWHCSNQGVNAPLRPLHAFLTYLPVQPKVFGGVVLDSQAQP